MMDYIYGLGEAVQAAREATPLGRAIFEYMGTRPSARAVRYRRQLIAGLIDRVAAGGEAAVLALAAGHLREAELSDAVQTGRIRDFVAFDQDEASLAVVARDYAHLGHSNRGWLGAADPRRKAESGPVRLRLCGRPLRLPQRVRWPPRSRAACST